MLKGKVAAVTGGQRGIGKAICEKLAENGADIAIIDMCDENAAQETVVLIEAKGVKARFYRCDVTDSASIKETFKAIIADFGTVDILVNNAGITKDKLAMMMSEDDFEKVLDVNLSGAFRTSKEVIPVMLKKHSGKIINISSISGIIGNAGQVNYSASKAGLIGMTKSLARELASRSITCNAVAPGFVETDMTKNLPDGGKALAESIPLRRFAQPEEIAGLVTFLASPAADYITGEVIRIDGGLAM